MKYLRNTVLITILGGWITHPVLADTYSNNAQPLSPWSIYVGAAHLQLPSSATVQVNDTVVPGGSIKTSSNETLIFGATYQFTPYIRGEIGGGIPPTTTIRGKGTLDSAGVLGKATYGPAVATVHFSPFPNAVIRPYIGVGGSWMIVFNTKDDFVKDLDIKNAVGPVAQIGVDIPLTQQWSAVIDIKKVWFKTHSKGYIPAMEDAAVRTNIDIEPLVTSLSLAYHF